jgi:glycosyltransferase involved in cell wall biosynthesis
MRIAYIAPYQGAALLKRRPIVRNLSLAAKVKIGLIAELLQRNSYSVEILSQGDVVEHQFKFYPALSEAEASNPDIQVYYASAVPIRFLNGLWSSLSMLRIFMTRHRAAPYDAVMIYNLKPPQVACANYAMSRLGLPIILQYEDGFDGVWAKSGNSLTSRYYVSKAKRLLRSVSACIAASPYLLSQTPTFIPKLLLRGVVGSTLVSANKSLKQNRVVFSGTHERTQGLEQLLRAWEMIRLPDWELHIAGQGPLTVSLQSMAENNSSIIFHGLLDRDDNARLLCTAKIGMNPMNASKTPGSDFAFKIVEYLAAGLHVITTPRGQLEPELEEGISYIKDNSPESIAAGLKKVINNGDCERTAEQAAVRTYGPSAVTNSLKELVDQVVSYPRK